MNGLPQDQRGPANRPTPRIRPSLSLKVSVFPAARGHPRRGGAAEDTGAFFRPVGDERRRLLYVIGPPHTLSANRRFLTG